MVASSGRGGIDSPRMAGAADSGRGLRSAIGPNRARYNDWQTVDVPALGGFTPQIPVSVVVPVFDAPEELARLLATLERQTYPRHLIEVIVVDDGSEPPLGPLQSPLDLRVVRREGRDFTAAAARNAGAAAAAHPILVFLDCDTLVDSAFLAAHARWHHAVADAITTVWFRYYVDATDPPATIRDWSGSLEALFSGHEADPSWLQAFVRNTSGLTAPQDQLFEVFVGIFGIRKAFFQSIGGFDESFTRYGWEDTEFGYRAQTCGALVVPVEDAPCWHQGRWQQNRTPEKIRAIELLRQKVANLIPHPGYRSPAPGRIYTVPQQVVTIPAGGSPHHAIAADVETLLADPVGDLVVRVELDPESGSDSRLWLEERFGPDPRVSVTAGSTALDDFPFAAFHLSVPVGACDPELIQRLRAALDRGGGCVAARMVRPGVGTATITRSWALHRSRRTGLSVEHFGDVATGVSGAAAEPVGG